MALQLRQQFDEAVGRLSVIQVVLMLGWSMSIRSASGGAIGQCFAEKHWHDWCFWVVPCRGWLVAGESAILPCLLAEKHCND